MFSADLTWTPMVDEVSIEAREKQPAQTEVKVSEPFNALPRPSRSLSARISNASGDNESVKSANSPRSRLMRWARSKGSGSTSREVTTDMISSPVLAAASPVIPTASVEDESEKPAVIVPDAIATAPIIRPKSARANFHPSNLPPITPVGANVVAEMPEDRGLERHELPSTPRSMPLPRRMLEPLHEERPPLPPPFNTYSHRGAADYSMPTTIRRDFQSRRGQSMDEVPMMTTAAAAAVAAATAATTAATSMANLPMHYQHHPALAGRYSPFESPGAASSHWRSPAGSSSSGKGSVMFDYFPSSPLATATSPSTTTSAPDLSSFRAKPSTPPPPLDQDEECRSPVVAVSTDGDDAAMVHPDSLSGLSTEPTPLPSHHVLSLIERMTSASASTRLNRIREEWVEPLDVRFRREIAFEKDLWLLTELLIRDAVVRRRTVATPLGPVRPLPALKRAVRILDVGSSPPELFQLAALQPTARIAHLTPASSSKETDKDAYLHPLPHNVASLPLPLGTDEAPAPGPLALPLGDASFDHVRATTAAGLFTLPQLKALLRECHRVLAVRGVLEVRIVDLVPRDAGPRLTRWLDSSFMLALESTFRCTRPAIFVPLWAKEAGFELIGSNGGSRDSLVGDDASEESEDWPGFSSASASGQAMCVRRDLAICVDEDASSDEERLEAELCRALIRNQYPSVKKWFWENEDCISECVERNTRFHFLTIFGFKS